MSPNRPWTPNESSRGQRHGSRGGSCAIVMTAASFAVRRAQQSHITCLLGV
jgi:hypothetical protein